MAKKKKAVAKKAPKKAKKAAAKKAPKKVVKKAAKKAAPKKAAPKKAAKPAPAKKAAKPKAKRKPNAAFMAALKPKNGLQDATNKRMINADDKLKVLFGKDQVSMFELAKIIGAHVSK